MTAITTRIAFDSAAEFCGLIGNDTTATFENNPSFIDSDPAWRKAIDLRDTDDTEDSEEEEEEFDEEDDEDEFDEDDDEDEPGAGVLRTTGSTNVRGPVKNRKRDVEAELEEMDEVDRNGAESIEEDVEAGMDIDEAGRDNPHVDRAIDAALRMRALAGAAAEFAASAYTLE